jgi:F-type H+-transporting ATPase subunit a
MLALEFPPIEKLVTWPAYFGEGTIFAFNKVGVIALLSMLIPTAMFLAARRDLVPAGLQHVTEGAVNFVQKQIILPAIGPDGLRYTPLLLSLFLFLFFASFFEVVPTFHLPGTSRMAVPGVLAVMVLVYFIAVGVKHNGAGAYLKSALFPPGLPKGLYVLVTPIELLSTFIIRPFSLAVRIFANLLAGHILILTFAVLCITLWQLSPLAAALPFSFLMLAMVVAFEMGVSFLQAFVFSLLTAVYIGGSLHPHH